MAQHQQALARYVTLDRCLSKFRFNKDELIDRCSEAVNRVSGDERRLSEKTFFNDIRALREGVVMGRKAPIKCSEGRYHYDDSGFSLFRADRIGEDLERLDQRLENMVTAAAHVWAIVRNLDLPQEKMEEIKKLLHSDEAVLLAVAHEKRPFVLHSRRSKEKMSASEIEEQEIRFKTYREGLVASLIENGNTNVFLLEVMKDGLGDLPSFLIPIPRSTRWKRLLKRLEYRRLYGALKRMLS